MEYPNLMDMAALTHEFKTPLCAITSAVHILNDNLQERRLDRDRFKTYLQMIQQHSDRLGSVVGQLLEAARQEHQASDWQPHQMDLVQCLNDLVFRLKPLAFEKGLRLEIEFVPPIIIWAEPEKMTFIFSNLLANAIQYTDAGGVRIQAQPGTSHIQVIISDSGRGFIPQEGHLIFSPFRRGQSSKNTSGTGLGLYIAKKWVDFHGGRIWAESPGPGHGSRFIVQLPVQPPSHG